MPIRTGAPNRRLAGPRPMTPPTPRLARRPRPPRCQSISVGWGRSARSARDTRLLGPAGRLPGGVDLVDQVEQLLGVGDVGRGLDLRRLLVGVPEQIVEVRDLVDVLRLEVVVPEDVEVMLDELGALFL